MNQLKPLSDLKHDQKGRVASVQPAAPNDFQRLVRAGVLPDTLIRVVDSTMRHGLYIVEHNVIALDRQTASGIFVEMAWQRMTYQGQIPQNGRRRSLTPCTREHAEPNLMPCGALHEYN